MPLQVSISKTFLVLQTNLNVLWNEQILSNSFWEWIFMWHSAGASVGQFKIHVNDNLGQLTYIYWEHNFFLRCCNLSNEQHWLSSTQTEWMIKSSNIYSRLPQRSLPKVINQTRSISIQDSFGKYFELSSTIEFKSLTASDRQPTPQSNFYWNFHTKLCSFPTKTHHYLSPSPPSFLLTE